MNCYEQAMNWIDPTKLITHLYCTSNSPYELHELNHEQHQLINRSLIFMICHELFLMNSDCSWTDLMNNWWTFISVHHLMYFISPGIGLIEILVGVLLHFKVNNYCEISQNKKKIQMFLTWWSYCFIHILLCVSGGRHHFAITVTQRSRVITVT